MKPGEDSTGGVWEVETATPGAILTILPVRVSPKDAQYGTILKCHFRRSQPRSVAARDADSSSLMLEHQPSHSTETDGVWSNRNRQWWAHCFFLKPSL